MTSPEGMTPSSWAGVITAVATVLIAVGGVITALSVLIPILRSSRKTEKAVADVHVIVNQQRTDAMRYQVALVRALRKAGIEVPDDQSLTAAPVAPPTDS